MDISQQLAQLQEQLAQLAAAQVAQTSIAQAPAPAPAPAREITSAEAREMDRDLGRSGTGKMDARRIQRIASEWHAAYPNGKQAAPAPAPLVQAATPTVTAQAPAPVQVRPAPAPVQPSNANTPGTKYDSPKSGRPQWTQVWAVHLPEFYANGTPAQYTAGTIVPVIRANGDEVQAQIHHVWIEGGLKPHHKPRIMALVVTQK